MEMRLEIFVEILYPLDNLSAKARMLYPQLFKERAAFSCVPHGISKHFFNSKLLAHIGTPDGYRVVCELLFRYFTTEYFLDHLIIEIWIAFSHPVECFVPEGLIQVHCRTAVKESNICAVCMESVKVGVAFKELDLQSHLLCKVYDSLLASSEIIARYWRDVFHHLLIWGLDGEFVDNLHRVVVKDYGARTIHATIIFIAFKSSFFKYFRYILLPVSTTSDCFIEELLNVMPCQRKNTVLRNS